MTDAWTPALEAEAARLCREAILGPWTVILESFGFSLWQSSNALTVSPADAAFIAASRTLLPAALAEIRRLRARVAVLEGIVEPDRLREYFNDVANGRDC